MGVSNNDKPGPFVVRVKPSLVVIITVTAIGSDSSAAVPNELPSVLLGAFLPNRVAGDIDGLETKT
jgi:hypothetical protein